MKYSILLVLIMAFGIFKCGTISKENELKEWEGWYGNFAGGEAYVLLTLENDSSLICKLYKEDGNNVKTLNAELYTDLSNVDLRFLPSNLISGIPHIREVIITDNFHLFYVEKRGIPEFVSDYYVYVPLAKKGSPMKKMDPPSHMTNSDD